MLGKYSFNREPVAWVNAIKAGLYAVILLWRKVTPEQFGAIWAFLEVASALIIRHKVFAPTSKDGAKLEAVKYEGQELQSVKSAEAA